MKKYKLSKSEFSRYKKDGYIIIKNVVTPKELFDIKNEIFLLSKNLYIKYNGYDDLKLKFENKNFDKYLIESKKKNLNKVTSSIYDVSKKIFTFLSIFSSEKMKKLCCDLMKTKRIGILNRGFGVRIDYPTDRFYKARLHQDYTSQIGSTNGLVMYLPLRSVRHKHGPVILYRSSHLNGPYDTKVKMELVKNKKTYDPFYVDLPKKKLKKFKKKELIINEGDIAFFNFCLLHESGFNHSDEIRWSMIARYMDFENKDAMEMDFIGGQHEGNIFKFKNKKPIKIQ